MRSVFRVCALGATIIAVSTSCGENRNRPQVPTGPTTLQGMLTPFLTPQVDGIWGGPVILTSVSGGTGPARNAGALECVGAAFTGAIGSTDDHLLAITQTGLDITARLTSTGTGLSCTYRGQIGTSGALMLTAATCDAPDLVFRCPPDPQGNVLVRRLRIIGSSISATLAFDPNPPLRVTSVSGTAAHTYNVQSVSGDEEDDVGGLVVNHRFDSLTRR